MSQPISWRNVNGPSPAEALRPLEAAGNSFNNAIGAFQQLLQQRQKLDAANYDQGQLNQREAFLDALQGARSPEELAALQQSGQLAQLQQGMNASTRAAVRGADEARTVGLRQQTLAANQFSDQTRDRANKPFLDQVGVLANGGDFEGARRLVNDSSLPNKAEVLNGIKIAERNALMQGREDTKYGQGQQLTAMEMKLKEAQFAETQRAAAEAAQTRALNAEVASMVQTRLKPPDLKAAIAEAIRTGKPVPDLSIGPDTAAADKAFEKLTASGKYSPELLAANRSKIRESFASNGLAPLIGKEAAARDRAAAENAVAFDEMDRVNPYAPGSANAQKNYNELALEVPNLIDKTSGWGSEKDVGPIQNLLGQLAQEGLNVDGVMVTPSINDVRWAIRSAAGSYFTDGGRADNIKKLLIERTKQSVFRQSLDNGEASAQYRRQQAVKEKLKAN